MRAVFSAMRRSFASMATALTSPSCGARRTSRSVSRTGIHLSRKDPEGISCSVMTQAPLGSVEELGLKTRPGKTERGRRYPPPPLKGPVSPAGSDRHRRTHYGSTVLFGRGLHRRKYRNEDAAFGFGIERDATFSQGEQRVVLANANVLAGMPLGSALARENVA